MDSYESWSSHNQASTAELENQLYQHWQNCRQQESADIVLERFRQLFIEAEGYTDTNVWDVLVELTQRPEANREFKYTLNRCSYTLINPWYTQPRDHWAIPELVRLFESVPQTATTEYATHRIRHLVGQFVETDQYIALRRFAHIFDEATADASDDYAAQPLARQLRRYPFLYDNSLLTQDSDQSQKENVLQLRQKAETQLGIKLARYRDRQRTPAERDRPLPNPTLLSAEALTEALAYYTGKVEGNRSHRDLAEMFRTYSKTARSFREFKEEFLEYLLAPLVDMAPAYVNTTFGKELRQYLRETMQDLDGQRITDSMVLTLCQKVLNFLVVKGRQQPTFRYFWRLIHEVGYTLTVGVLLRVVLFCAAVKPWLENRMAVLFNHHEQAKCAEVPWLIDAFEHTNVALITNFGKIGYSF